ncbi:MAG: hypothetical protein E3J86_13950 [Candidatus Thorarchaeota archaeon]|nr:MAG: hypothetical protein E3J86_13950 [Candidatus Thorarchaeota archaeon]
MSKSDAYWDLVKYSLSIGVIAIFILFLMEYLFGGGISGEPMPYTYNFSPEMLAGIIGVAAGFGLSGWAAARQDERRIPEIILIIREELERIRNEAGDANHLPIWVWKSLVNSGDANLLHIDLQRKLYEIYSAIERLNIETDRERRHRGVKDGAITKLCENNRALETVIHNMISDLLQTSKLDTQTSK